MVLMRVCDVATAGVFTLAYANADLFLIHGKYGERNFQVDDVNEKYLFGVYVRSRAISTLAIVLFGGLYVALVCGERRLFRREDPHRLGDAGLQGG